MIKRKESLTNPEKVILSFTNLDKAMWFFKFHILSKVTTMKKRTLFMVLICYYPLYSVYNIPVLDTADVHTTDKYKLKYSKKLWVSLVEILQVPKNRTEDDKIPSKKRRILIRKIKSSKKGNVSVICESKPSIRM